MELRRFAGILTCNYVEINVSELTLTCDGCEEDIELAIKTFNTKVIVHEEFSIHVH
jgi:hypothetical protein